MFIVTDDKIINCDNVACIEIFPCNHRFQVRANYGYDIDNIIETNSKEDAQKVIRRIAFYLAEKEKVVSARELKSVCDPPTKDELLKLFRSKNK